MSIFRRNQGGGDARGPSEQALLWAAIADSSHDAILVVDESGVIEFANPAAEQLFRCSQGEIVGENVLRFLPAPGASAATRRSRRLTAITHDGHTIPVEIELRDVHTPTRRVVTLAVRSLVGSTDDASELFKQVVGAEPAMLLVTDQAGRIVLFNRACEEFTEFAAAEVRGKCVGEALAAADESAEIDAAWLLILRGKGPRQTECDWVTRRGARKRVTCRHEILRSDLGLPSHVVTVVSEAGKSVEFDSALLKDIPTLLTSIVGHADLALQSLAGNDSVRMDIENIKKAGTRAAEIVSEAINRPSADN